MKNTIYTFCLVAYLFCSCEKTEKDFVGSYKTLYPAKINEDFGSNFSFYSKGRFDNAKQYFDLVPINLDIFQEAGSGILKGELKVLVAKSDGFADANTQLKTANFDLSNMHLINGDTLEFSIDNAILKLAGKRSKGQLVINGNKVALAFENDMILKNATTSFNPLFLKLTSDKTYFSILTKDSNVDSITNKFYNEQIKMFDKAISEKDVSSEKIKIFSNSRRLLIQKLK